MGPIEIKHNELKALITQINLLSLEISENRILFFKDITISIRFHNSEVCFGDLINWLYVLNVEVSTPSLKFFTQKFQLYAIGVPIDTLDVFKLVHALRTVTSHNMDHNSLSDVGKINYCQDWYSSIVGKQIPENEGDWHVCIDYLLDKVTDYLKAIHTCITTIFAAENYDIVLEQWDKLCFRDYGVFEFETVLEKVLYDHGLDDIFDTNKIVKSQIDKWKDQLKVLHDGFDFSKEAYRIISNYIQKSELCPVGGDDLIALGARRGPQIKTLMEQVRKLFYESPCKKEVLVQRILDSAILEVA